MSQAMPATMIPFPGTEAGGGEPPAAPHEHRPRLQLAAKPQVSDTPAIWSSAAIAVGPLTTARARAMAGSVASLAPELEAELISVLTRPLAPGESHLSGNANREHDLCAVLGRLDVAQAFQLGRRLDAARPGDALVSAFGRMTIERRHRIRTFIADTRRRAALRG